jgi:hypothetical protein
VPGDQFAGAAGAPGPDLPAVTCKGLLSLKSMGAVVMILALRTSFRKKAITGSISPSRPGILSWRWSSIPTSSPEHFGGEHILYCGDYLDPTTNISA